MPWTVSTVTITIFKGGKHKPSPNGSCLWQPGFPTLSTVYPSPNKAQGPLGSTRVPRLRAARCKGISVSSVLQLISARAWLTLGLILFFGTIIYYHVVKKCYQLLFFSKCRLTKSLCTEPKPVAVFKSNQFKEKAQENELDEQQS